jgi:Domain of unknown function (DUF5753)/Helix-turn-helix domain
LPASGSPTARRRELGVLLRGLRTEHGLTVDQVADRLMCSRSKVSRFETGQRGVSALDIRELCDLYGVDDAMRQRLSDLAHEGKEPAWWQSSGLPYSRYVGLEAGASSISDFGLGLIPGLLQTPDYARAVLRLFGPLLTDAEIEQRLTGRLDRQRILARPNPPPPRLEALIDEGVLYRVAGNRSIMRAQLEWLLEASDRPNVDIGVLPYTAGLLPSSNNKFIILRFAEPAVPSMVFLEALTTDQFLESDEDVAAYEGVFDAMRSMAAPSDGTRALITAALSAAG